MAQKTSRSSNEVYQCILACDDWIQALGKLYYATEDKNTFEVLKLIENIHISTENVAKEMQKGTADKAEEWAEKTISQTKLLMEKIES